MQGNTLMDSLRQSFKPALLTRILFDGNSDDINKILYGKSSITLQDGGAGKKLSENERNLLPGFMDIYFGRASFFFLLLFTSYYIAIKIMDSDAIKEGLLKDERIDNTDRPWSKKLVRLTLYLLVFVLIVAALLWSFQKLIYFGFYAYVSSQAKPGEEVGPIVEELYDRVFFKFQARESDGNISHVHSMLRYSIWGVFIMFLVYILFVRSFVSHMSYPTYAKEDKEERSSERKFLIFYSLISLYVFLTMIVVFCGEWTWSNDKIMFVFTLLMFGFMTLLVTLVFRYELRRDNLRVMLFFALLVVVVIVNWKLLN